MARCSVQARESPNAPSDWTTKAKIDRDKETERPWETRRNIYIVLFTVHQPNTISGIVLVNKR